MKWNEMVNANWMRASIKAESPSPMAPVTPAGGLAPCEKPPIRDRGRSRCAYRQERTGGWTISFRERSFSIDLKSSQGHLVLGSRASRARTIFSRDTMGSGIDHILKLRGSVGMTQ